MSEQIKVGEWVHHDPKDMDGVLLATHHEWAWVDYGGRFPLCELRENLTLISPDVPQPKFRVGQRVDLVNCTSGHPGIIEEVIQGTSYKVRWGRSESICNEDRLRLLEVCPTCGGKVGDE